MESALVIDQTAYCLIQLTKITLSKQKNATSEKDSTANQDEDADTVRKIDLCLEQTRRLMQSKINSKSFMEFRTEIENHLEFLERILALYQRYFDCHVCGHYVVEKAANLYRITLALQPVKARKQSGKLRPKFKPTLANREVALKAFEAYLVDLEGFLSKARPIFGGHESKRKQTSQSGRFADSTKEAFLQEVVENDELDQNLIQQLIGVLEVTITSDSQDSITYGVSSDTGLQGLYLRSYANDRSYIPINLNSAGKLGLECKDLSVHHRINRRLVEQLVDHKLFGKTESNKTKSRSVLNLAKSKAEEIDKLCEFYERISQLEQAD